MRWAASNPDHQPCHDGYAVTKDGWRLGIRHYFPQHPDPTKDPVVLCHGLGLNGTFWTITDNHLPLQLAQHGYRVFVVDLRGSGGSHRGGIVGHTNLLLRETMMPEIGNRRWTMDDLIQKDVPAILDYVCEFTGSSQVNWIGHSLGGMFFFPYLELTPQPERIRAFVAMGSPAMLEKAPQTRMLRASGGIRALLRVISTGRMARGMCLYRPRRLQSVDSLYYSAANVDESTISRFYAYTLEDLGRGALKQLSHYLEHGHLVSADGKIDYAERLHEIRTPTLVVAGDGDVMASLQSCRMTFDALGSTDKTLMRCGKSSHHVADYGHCDLVWSRHAPREVFPEIIRWLDARQPGAVNGASPPPLAAFPAPSLSARIEQALNADLGPGFEEIPLGSQVGNGDEAGLDQPIFPR